MKKQQTFLPTKNPLVLNKQSEKTSIPTDNVNNKKSPVFFGTKVNSKPLNNKLYDSVNVGVLKMYQKPIRKSTQLSMKGKPIVRNLNLTEITKPYFLSRKDRRLNGILFFRYKESITHGWNVHNDVKFKVNEGVTLIVVGEGLFEMQDYIQKWSE